MRQKKKSNRREFLKNAGKAGLAIGIAMPALSSLANTSGSAKRNSFDNDITWAQQPLNYSYNSIEPAIDAATMEIHYTKHAAGYTKNLAYAVKDENIDSAHTSVAQLLHEISKYSVKMRNNAGGHYNHELFWKSIKAPVQGNAPSGKLAELLTRDFNSFDTFKLQFGDVAKSRFGSGWAWLIYTDDKKLKVSSTPNQDNPLMDISDVKGSPIVGLDVWEHAYYLKYQNKRPDYINAWWSIIDWDYVQKRFSTI